MGTDLAEALLDIATILLPYGISKKDSDKIADDFQAIIESFKGLETAFYGLKKAEERLMREKIASEIGKGE